MPNVTEFNRKIEISIGAIAFIVVATFTITKFYTSITMLEARMDKRYERHEQHFKHLDAQYKMIEERIHELEVCDH